MEIGLGIDMHRTGDAHRTVAMKSLADAGIFDLTVLVKDEDFSFGKDFSRHLRSSCAKHGKGGLPGHIWVFGRGGRDIVRACRELDAEGLGPVVLADYCSAVEKGLPAPVHHGVIGSRADLEHALEEIRRRKEQEEEG